MKEGDIGYCLRDGKKIKLLLGMPAYPDLTRYWVKIMESKHPKYKRGMTFIINIEELVNARLR